MRIGFEGRSVLVTGAARGIGGGIAAAFAERGARVVATDLLEAELAALARRVAPGEGGSLTTRRLDVTDAAAFAALVAATGAPDVLVHVAGGVRGQSPKPFDAVTEAEWDAIQDANVKGAFLAARAVVPGMKAAGYGRIVVISSRAGLGVSRTGIQSYGTAKAAQLGLVRQLGHELGRFGITVNAVAPGFLRTSPDYERQWESYGAAGQRAMVEGIAMRRLGEPETLPMPCCSSLPTTPPGSPDRCCR
ncbi:SDR family NAD(P)-dependent oxidoreductase [Teichococcus rhizosphaerae]|uniref:SDR family NAD(P)-dependent oxidoreductase n=1 Tax=Teichococcus rhizosphaerae TaxID=1335062 RepID=UPI0026D67EA5